MIDGYLDLLDVAVAGAQAAADGDGGRSARLMQSVADAMADMSLAECEWLSIAVSNGAFSRQMYGPSAVTGEDIHIEKTSAGEVWDI